MLTKEQGQAKIKAGEVNLEPQEMKGMLNPLSASLSLSVPSIPSLLLFSDPFIFLTL